ncbi:MAG: glutamate--tRNA ligase [Bacteroidetes bacterium]|nr:glutamate--tRNA ligase [Bacteroidota bacterium]
MDKIRTRFAPSPTGFLHVGGLRTALYNYLFAKKNNGDFILRIEDTDQNRLVEGAIENLISTLHWAGIEYDEGPNKIGAYGPYIQSQRLKIYKTHAEKLIENENAYYCFCSHERLGQIRAKQIELHLPPSYDRLCRQLSKDQVDEKLKNNEPHVIRMKIPLSGEILIEDIVRGKVSFVNKILDDQVILKSDGFPTYHLAVVVDDHLMEISHVIRGEEWLPSTPKHILLYNYFGWEIPKFAHLPLLLNADKSKLSKRQGDVAVEDYMKKGFLQESLNNFIALLGWHPSYDREIFSMEELKNEFTLERVGKSGAIFNVEKLIWLNQQHIRKLKNEKIFELLKTDFDKVRSNFSKEYILKTIELLKERVLHLTDFINNSTYFFEDPKNYSDEAVSKNWKPDSKELMKKLLIEYENLEDFSLLKIEDTLKQLSIKLNIKIGVLINPFRLLISGTNVGPSVFHIAELIGKQKVLSRMKFGLEKL